MAVHGFKKERKREVQLKKSKGIEALKISLHAICQEVQTTVKQKKM